MHYEKDSAEDRGLLIKLLIFIQFASFAVIIAMSYLLLKQEQLLKKLAVVSLLLLTGLTILVTTVTLISVIMLYSRRNNKVFSGKMAARLLSNVLIPIMALGKFMGFSREKIQRAYAHINNRVVYANGARFEPEDVLLLLPHCLQNSNCKHRITGDINNCTGCGRCKIASLAELGRKTGVKTKIVPGGTLARKVIEDVRPKAVVAVACENDLSSGIRDSRGLPIVGVLNKRPYGPCHNTDVDVAEVERAIDFFIGRREH